MDVIARYLAGLALVMGAASAHAALIAVDGGKLVDDTDNDTLWVSDGNLFHTLANAGGDPSGFVQKVIGASHGVIADTPNENDTPANSGTYLLTADDLHPDNGLMTWYGAKAFVNYLNSIAYAGYADWRLPVTADVLPFSPTLVGTGSGESNPSAGELAQLFFTALGGTSGDPSYVSSLNADAALFTNLQGAYHYGTEGLVDAPDRAWALNVGIVYAPGKIGNKSAFATLPVRSGQASVKDLLAAVQGELKTGGGPLAAAGEKLHETCVDLTQFESGPSSGDGAIPDSYLKADVKAVGAVIGCH